MPVLAYWDLESDFPLHFLLAPNEQPRPVPNNGHMSGKLGYGFSYVFREAAVTKFQSAGIRLPRDRNSFPAI